MGDTVIAGSELGWAGKRHLPKPCTESPISTTSHQQLGEVHGGLICSGADLVEEAFLARNERHRGNRIATLPKGNE